MSTKDRGQTPFIIYTLKWLEKKSFIILNTQVLIFKRSKQRDGDREEYYVKSKIVIEHL